MLFGSVPKPVPDYAVFNGDVEEFLDSLSPDATHFDLVATSPPYNIGKSYEKRTGLDEYMSWQSRVIEKIVSRLKPGGSVCWQVGNHVKGTGRKAVVTPLDILFHPVFESLGLTLRNRIVWKFGHGTNAKLRFSGRYETVMWYTKGDDYTFNLDPVRIPQKYPGKKHYRGPKKGEYSGNPLGKNPEDVWDIPNVKANHIEKTIHPCQYPVGLLEPLILALTNEGDLVFDPYAGVCTTGAAAALHSRRFWGCEIDRAGNHNASKEKLRAYAKQHKLDEALIDKGTDDDLRAGLNAEGLVVPSYAEIGAERVQQALDGTLEYRPWDKPVYDSSQTKLSELPIEMLQARAEAARGDGGIQLGVDAD